MRVAAPVLLACLLSCSKEDGATQAGKTETVFSKRFEPSVMLGKIEARFSSLRGQGQRANVQITPPGRTFKDFTVRGEAADDALAGGVAGLKEELIALAKSAGATIVQPPKDTSADRVKWLPYGSFKDVYQEGLRGFHFTYSQGGVEGGVDVLAAHGTVDGKKEWMLVCSVHEAR